MKPGRVRSFTFESRALAGNPLGDPAAREVWTWEPPDADSGSPLPVIYGLIGFTGQGKMLLNESPWAPGLHQRLDGLYREGKIPPLLVVLPDCFTRYGGSQYVNSSATGAYRDYLCEELVPEVERRYSVLADRGHRFVFGKSSGGFGAVSLGMDRPDLFGGIACQSGDMAFEYCYLPDFPHTADMLARYGGLDGFLNAFDLAPRKTDDFLRAMNIVAMAACYSPDPAVPGAFRLPFDPDTARLRPEVWQQWLDLDPVRRIHDRLDALRSLAVLFLDCGSRDEFNLYLGARMFRETLERNSVPHTYEEFDDGHMNISYRYEASIGALGRAWAATSGTER